MVRALQLRTRVVVTGPDLLMGTVSGALIVMSGAVYALCFAMSCLRRSAGYSAAAWLAYGVLVVFTLILGRALELDGPWRVIIAVMLVGYLLAPVAIWHLCEGTHFNVQSSSANKILGG